MYNPKLHSHFTGIGGSGMSGIAEVLLTLGFKVSGSDLKPSDYCERLKRAGAIIFYGHAAENLLEGTSLLVYSSAVSQENVEVLEARRRGIPVIRRAEVLAELMRLKFGVAVAGSHGKTTTTSMTAAIMESGGLDPTVIIGGIVKSLGTGGRLGKSNYLVAETDESDRSFLLLKPTVAVVTNIDSEHLEAYGSTAELDRCFEQFIQQVPFYGLVVLCIDDHKVRDLAQRYSGRKTTYGFSLDAQIRADNIVQDRSLTSYEVFREGEKLFELKLPMPGRHLVLNSLAAIAVGLEFGIAPDAIKSALEQFSGVARRLEIIGSVNGVTVINDYAHHPTEVRASLRAVKEGWQSELKRLHVIFQPHRYSRTRDCFIDFLDAFRDCDNLVVTEIHPAGEAPIDGVSGELLCEKMSHPSRQYVSDPEAVLGGFSRHLETGDVVLCMGAGSIGGLASKLVAALHDRADRSI